MLKTGYIYILANDRHGTMYVWVTNNLERRLYEHKNNLVKWFTEKYNIHTLVYFEEAPDIKAAIEREKQIKSWKREKKILLIEELNPAWEDLSKDW